MRISAAVFEKLYTPFSVADVEIGPPGPGKPVLRMPD